MMVVELYRKHRPDDLAYIRGQKDAVLALQTMLDKKTVPHALGLFGASGCGKTTAARILQKELGCQDADFIEVNGADSGGIETVRTIKETIGYAGLCGGTKIWYIDEAHRLTTPAQDCLLKLLEDPPDHAYYFLSTTEPDQLITTVRSRLTPLIFRTISAKDMYLIVSDVLDLEDVALDQTVIDRIVECAMGNARSALVLLHKVINMDKVEDQLDAILKSDTKHKANELYGLLIKRRPWAEVSPVLTDLIDDPEGIRRLILACLKTTMIKGDKRNAPWALATFQFFRDPFYATGAAGLVAACMETTYRGEK